MLQQEFEHNNSIGQLLKPYFKTLTIDWIIDAYSTQDKESCNDSQPKQSRKHAVAMVNNVGNSMNSCIWAEFEKVFF